MATYEPAKRATEYITYIGLTSQAAPGTMQSSPTIAAGDFKVSIDGGALANLTTLPTVTPAAGKMVKISLSIAEMTGDNITVVCSDAAGAEWCDVILNIPTSARQIDDLATPTNITAGTITTVTTLTNLPSITAGWLTAAGIAAAALNGKGDWNIGKTGYTLTATTGLGAQTANITGNLSGSVGSVTGAVGSVTGLTASNLDATVSSRLASASYTAPSNLTAAQIATGVWTDTTAGDFTVALSIGKTVVNGVTLGTGLTVNDITIKTGRSLLATTGLGNQTADITGTLSGTVGGIAGTTQTLDALQTAQNTAHGAGSWATATGFATPTNITAATGVVLSGVTHTGAVIPTVTTVGTLTTYTGNTPQTGDSFARIGAAGVGLTAVALADTTSDGVIADAVWNGATATYGTAGSYGLLVETNLNAPVSGATAPTAAAVADAVWDEELTGATHNIANSAGRRLRTLQTGGNYEGGMVWVDTINGVAGTVTDENGVVTNPVDTWADALTLAAAIPLKEFHIANGSTVTLSAASDNYVLQGHEWTLELGTQSVASSMFIDASISGTGTGTDSEYEDCIFGITSLPAMQAYNCSFTATTSGGFTMSAAGDYRFINCQSGVAGAGKPLFTFGTGAITAEFRRWSGGIALAGVTADDVITISGELGTIDLGSPSGAADIQIRGTYKAITNVGSAVVNTDGAILAGDVAAILADTAELQTNQGAWATATGFTVVGDIPTTTEIADAVHDEVVDGTKTFRQSTRIQNAALAGKASGLDTTTAVYRDLADTVDRITATVDTSGNRTAVTLDDS